MKTLIYLILLSFTLLHASLSEAEQSCNNQNYTQCYDQAYTAFLENMGSVTANKLLAESATKLKNFDAALGAYERLLIIDDSDTHKLGLAQLYITMGSYPDAEATLNTLSTHSKKADSLRAKISQKRKKHTLNGYLQLGGGYDMNINANPGGTVLQDYFLENFGVTNLSQTINDYFTNQIGYLGSHYDFGDSKGWGLSNQLTAYNKMYLYNSDFNILFARYSLGLTHTGSIHRFILPIEGDYIGFGNKPLLYSYAFSPEFTLAFSPQFDIKFNAKIQPKIYLNPLFAQRNALQQSYGAKVRKLAQAETIALAYQMQKSNKSILNSTETFIDYTTHAVTGEYQRDILFITLKASSTFKLFLFDEVVPASLTRRVDGHVYFSSSASMPIFTLFDLSANYDLTYAMSNFAIVNFMMQTFAINISKSF